MLIWDVPYNMFSSKVYIGFDADRTENGAGFKLDWVSEIDTYNLRDVVELLNYLRVKLVYYVQLHTFTGNGAIRLTRRVNGYYNSLIESIKEDKPCASPSSRPVPERIIPEIEAINTRTTARQHFDFSLDIVFIYLRRCPGSRSWSRIADNILLVFASFNVE
ncbi:Oidioi.mRNA.OKI2018_I69.chr1.g403.t1.cds [Oikopleura dioica]|uniref:Oidioi.mRNA.OKI2018_I69.chr1.g403.t1.cds n=1 Tax=Oikopleura dioica TaxID=34765 RepID=A0ABN7SP03_OIKDI|nr:Oidioi.mRNA.OKI2018_I69.chr1.g403.t1.cds [Oikopleura dioica]